MCSATAYGHGSFASDMDVDESDYIANSSTTPVLMSLDALFDAVAWVPAPANVSAFGRIFADSDAEDVYDDLFSNAGAVDPACRAKAYVVFVS